MTRVRPLNRNYSAAIYATTDKERLRKARRQFLRSQGLTRLDSMCWYEAAHECMNDPETSNILMHYAMHWEYLESQA